LGGVRIDRLYLCDDRLVIVGDEKEVWIVDAVFGRGLRRVESRVGVARRIDVVGETIVVWGAGAVVGIGSGTLEEAWARRCVLVEDTVVVVGRPWIAYRGGGEREWRLLDVSNGEDVFDGSLGAFEAIWAVVVDGERVLAAGLVDRGEGVARVMAVDTRDGAPRWSRDFRTGAEVNATQLAGHPDIIPILLAAVDERHGAAEEVPLPAIQLVDKRDGALGERFSIREDCRPVVEGACEMYMLVTPTRMIVQAGGNLVAYGNSPLRRGP